MIKKHQYVMSNYCQCYGDCDCNDKPKQVGYYYTIPYSIKHYNSKKAARQAIGHLYKPILI